ncbi:MAG TPA: zf-HC2 domain-containing protein [Ktedonobacterales bacterium]|nr:zf-HC2 domain-containing protein [Ktedonobacterales bacterium]
MVHSDWELQRERLSAYLDGELGAEERVALDAHLSGCERCQDELAALRQTRSLLRALPTPAMPRAFTLPAQPAVAERRRSAPAWTRPAQAIGSVAAMIGLGMLVTASLPHMDQRATSAGSATYAGSSAHMPQAAATLSPAGTSPTLQAGINAATPTSVSTPAYAPVNTGSTPAPVLPALPLLPVSGGVLLVGGAATVAAGGLARRRARRGDVAAD